MLLQSENGLDVKKLINPLKKEKKWHSSSLYQKGQAGDSPEQS